MTGGGVRILGGVWRGRAVVVPAAIRPTGGKVREALFSIWSDLLEGSAFLDLFAGSGAVGLEALSRGAERLLLVEQAAASLRALRDNCRRLEASGATVWRATLPGDLTPSSRVRGAPFDLVFADPPYRFGEFDRLLAAIDALLGADGEAAIEHSVRADLPAERESLTRVSCRRYGESAVSFYRRGRPSTCGG